MSLHWPDPSGIARCSQNQQLLAAADELCCASDNFALSLNMTVELSIYDSVSSVFGCRARRLIFLQWGKIAKFSAAISRPKYGLRSCHLRHLHRPWPSTADSDSCAILLPVPPGGAVDVFQFFAFNSKTRLRTMPSSTSLERACDPQQNAVKKWGYLSGLAGQGPQAENHFRRPWDFLWSN